MRYQAALLPAATVLGGFGDAGKTRRASGRRRRAVNDNGGADRRQAALRPRQSAARERLRAIA